MGKLTSKLGNIFKFRKKWKYKYHKIVFDVLVRRTKISDLKHAMKVSEVIEDMIRHKKVKLKSFKKLTPKSLDRAVDIHNKYTNGVKYNFNTIVNMLRGFSNQIINNRNNRELLDTLVRGLSHTNPALNVAYQIFNFAMELNAKNGK